MLRRPALPMVLVLLAASAAGCNDEQASRPATTTAAVANTIAAAPTPPTTPIRAWRAVIDDWYDNGRFDHDHECGAVREAAEHVPRSGHNYSSAYQDLVAIAETVCAKADSR